MRLILLRHAKSSWKSDAATDWARPLKGRGRRDAPVIGLRLIQHGWEPERVVCSDAARTRETWERLGVDAPITFHRELYHGGLGALRDVVGAPGVGTLMAIGHNPGWEDAVEQLTGSYVRMTTCNAVLLRAPSWTADRWDLVDVLRPRPPRS